jgi:hypothetical protein
MSIFENFNQFLETRLEEFLKQHPNLQIQILIEQLEEQEKDTKSLIAQLEIDKTQLEKDILSLGEQIKLWHERIDKAVQANRVDLAQAAQEREAALLRQGNQTWGRMIGVKERIKKSQELLVQIQKRKDEVEAKYKQQKANQQQQQQQTQKTTDYQTRGWQNSTNYNSPDDLEQKFKELEIDEMLRDLKRKS